MILVFSPKITPRLEYTTGLIFRDILGTEIKLTSDPDLFIRSEEPKINYSDSQIMARGVREKREDKLHNELILQSTQPLARGVREEREEKSHTGLFLRADQLLYETWIKHIDPAPINFEGETGFFGTSPESFLPFDPFASTFLLVSRMEEYLPGERDRFGRFPAKASLLYRNGLLEKPVVNHWAMLIAREMEKYYGKTIFPERKFRFLPTIDIDNAWAYRHKGFFRTMGGLGKELLRGEFRNFWERMLVFSGRTKDPYDTYDYLYHLFKSHETDIIVFYLMSNYGKYDKQVPWQNRYFRNLIKVLGQKFESGIHPSMASSKPGNHSRIKMEKERLELILGKTVFRSRQHYLRITLPDTYCHLFNAGITEDYSMGYPDLPGFRAGICTPFNFYDLSREMTTTLKIFPFQVMEATFLQYLNIHPSGALEKILSIMEEVREAGGLFSVIWHNESLGNNGKMEEWKNVFEKMVLTGFRYADQL
jgi:hypothetical protein